MISDEFIENLPRELNEGVIYIVDEILRIYVSVPLGEDKSELYDDMMEVYILAEEFLKSHGHKFIEVDITGDKGEAVSRVAQFGFMVKDEFELV